LLAHGANVDGVNATMQTPLHYAAWQGHNDIASVLIGHGADIDAQDELGLTALHRAVKVSRNTHNTHNTSSHLLTVP